MVCWLLLQHWRRMLARLPQQCLGTMAVSVRLRPMKQIPLQFHRTFFSLSKQENFGVANLIFVSKKDGNFVVAVSKSQKIRTCGIPFCLFFVHIRMRWRLFIGKVLSGGSWCTHWERRHIFFHAIEMGAHFSLTCLSRFAVGCPHGTKGMCCPVHLLPIHLGAVLAQHMQFCTFIKGNTLLSVLHMSAQFFDCQNRSVLALQTWSLSAKKMAILLWLSVRLKKLCLRRIHFGWFFVCVLCLHEMQAFHWPILWRGSSEDTERGHTFVFMWFEWVLTCQEHDPPGLRATVQHVHVHVLFCFSLHWFASVHCWISLRI